MISESDIYQLQAHAIATGDQRLRHLTYTALGHDAKISMMPTTLDEKLRAQQSCADQFEILQAMGVVLRTSDEESIRQKLPIGPPVHVIDQTDQPYG